MHKATAIQAVLEMVQDGPKSRAEEESWPEFRCLADEIWVLTRLAEFLDVKIGKCELEGCNNYFAYGSGCLPKK